jgi:hypothetical protein
MVKLTAFALIPAFAGFLCAQTETRTTTTTTYMGTLLDAGCVATHTETKETTTDERSTTTTTTTKNVQCPVTTETTAFELVTSEGKHVRFDPESNTKIISVVKGNKEWTKTIHERGPLQVRVVGTPRGDVVVLDSIH